MLNHRGPVSRMIGESIGMVQEYRADRAERKASQSTSTQDAHGNEESVGAASETSDPPSHSQPPPAYDGHLSSQSDDESVADDEELAQILDEAGVSHSIDHNEASSENIDQTIDDFLAHHPPPPYSERSESALPMPVIIPQRRPESRHRGFVRAYAPALQNAGIDQATWLGFLDGFEKSIKANPVFHVLNIGVFVAGHVSMAVQGVSITATAVTMVAHVSLEAGRRGYLHYKENGYLDRMNDEFFKPRGLYALIIKYKPKEDALMETVDVESNITKQISERDGSERAKWKNIFTSSSGTANSEAEIPEMAPLVFPDLDAMNDKEKENAVKHFGHFASEYFDRRAQATFETKHPDSKLPVAPRKDFASRYSDPNHPASTGGLISIATGGKMNPIGPLGRMRQRRGKSSNIGGNGESGKLIGGKQRGSGGPMKRMLKQDALYLMVVNLPTKEESERILSVME